MSVRTTLLLPSTSIRQIGMISTLLILGLYIVALSAPGTNAFMVGVTLAGWALLQMLPVTRIKNSLVVNLFGLVILFFIVGALAGPLANSTTGITIAHTGFTPNPNITSSPGAAPLLQIFPLIAFASVVIGALAVFEAREQKIL